MTELKTMATAAIAEKENIETANETIALAGKKQFRLVLERLERTPEHWTVRDSEGHSVLHFAAYDGNKAFVQLALAHGVDVDALSNKKQSPLMFAITRGYLGTERLLLDEKASIVNCDSLGATPLIIAVQYGQLPSMLLLLLRGKDSRDQMMMASDNEGCTAAHWAAFKGNAGALRLLDLFGANLMAVDKKGMMPIHRAASASMERTIRYLWERNADLDTRDGDGKTCMDIAQERHDTNLVALLEELLRANSEKTFRDVNVLNAGRSMEEGAISKDTNKMESSEKEFVNGNLLLKILPTSILVGVSLAMVEFLMDLRELGYQILPTASLLFELSVPLTLSLFVYCALSDPGKLREKSAIEELMGKIDSGTIKGEHIDISRLCTTTWILKDLRTRYSTGVGACVREFDHFCPWLNNGIGRENHRQFVALLVVGETLVHCHLYLLWNLSFVLVPYTNLTDWIVRTVFAYPMMSLAMIIQSYLSFSLFVLNKQALRLIAMNLTMVESMNKDRYEHFWDIPTTGPRRMEKIFCNPFDKGGAISNCADFWWFRRRSEMFNATDK
eukprot:TRINITY_DN68368_c0_g1_i1.p1 TRINITY_DN68368_c0_g1~~TRINITY_DN68368_c0_g1_i1.p1  ORF type:complete len:574 (-),score=84.52 TRINITY_DN68368_c0_g1_i1:86-1762(-)